MCVIAFVTPNANLPANVFALSAALLIRLLPVFVGVVFGFLRFDVVGLLIVSVCVVVGYSLSSLMLVNVLGLTTFVWGCGCSWFCLGRVEFGWLL